METFKGYIFDNGTVIHPYKCPLCGFSSPVQYYLEDVPTTCEFMEIICQKCGFPIIETVVHDGAGKLLI